MVQTNIDQDNIKLLINACMIVLRGGFDTSDQAQVIGVASIRRVVGNLIAIQRLVVDPVDEMGDCLLDLSRQIFETTISIKYIYNKDTEKRADRFIRYQHAEKYLSIQSLKGFSDYMTIDEAQEKLLEKNFEQNKKDLVYINEGKEEVKRHWAGNGIGVEPMLKELLQDGKLIKPSNEQWLHMYSSGNRANHFSSIGVMSYVEPSYKSINRGLYLQALGITNISTLTLIDTYLDKYPPSKEIDVRIAEINTQISRISEVNRRT